MPEEWNTLLPTSENDDELYEHFSLKVDKGQSLIRIDKFVTNHIPNISRNKIQNAIDAGNLLVNKKVVKSNYRVRPNDEIQIVLASPPVVHEAKAENIPLEIVFEDEHILIINKPSNMVVHPAPGNFTGTLLNGLLYHLNKKNLPEILNHPVLVHRIDKDTTGLMVIAKSELAQQHLANLFFHHDIERFYYALVWGNVQHDKGTISGYIARHTHDRMQFYNYSDANKGKHAVTHYEVIERFHYVTLVKCILETGRTHQIRVHMKHLGHTLFNDARYEGNRILAGTLFGKYKAFVDNCFTLCGRQALHAARLGFTHPVTKQHISFEQPLPADMQSVIEKWRNYASATLKK